MTSKEIKDRIKEMENYFEKLSKNKDKNVLIYFPSQKLVQFVLDLYKNYDYISETLMKVSEVNDDIEKVNESIGNIKTIVTKITDKRKKQIDNKCK
jgi:Rad3-related DNA helicase